MTDDRDLDKAFAKLTRKIIRDDPVLFYIGRILAPAVNRALEQRSDIKTRHVTPQIKSRKRPPPDAYCPGCGDRSLAPDLCPECLEYDSQQGSDK